jgi:hypothetical protein
MKVFSAAVPRQSNRIRQTFCAFSSSGAAIGVRARPARLLSMAMRRILRPASEFDGLLLAPLRRQISHR